MCRIKIPISNNSTLSPNSEFKIGIYGAQDPLLDTVCSINTAAFLAYH